MNLAWARQPEVGLPRPDVCLFLDISPQEAAKRGGFGEERYESNQMQTRVRELYAELQTSLEKDDFMRIDAGQSPEQVEQDIHEAVMRTFKLVDEQNLPLRRVESW